ncbi:MAG: ammonia-dependent NAD(+) synthetase [Comamonadaceae bacterium]|nr:MAG: ammonia-dependent NAD(+) synthetase [Comamonadaceae bacterium]
MNDLSQREKILQELQVARQFDASAELERRVEFLARYLATSGRRSYVLGISGGVDSLVAGALAQRAVSRLRAEGVPARFIAVRLPYGAQKDEAEASRCVDFIAPDEAHTVNIRSAVDALHAQLAEAGVDLGDAAAADFHVGNVKARMRMIAQYAIAGASAGLVIGTDHAAEALMGFFTKHGDGAADILPLAGLSKRRVRAVGLALGAPSDLVMKVPTADLESLAPLRPDEDAFGVSYETIDDFLEGLPIEPAAERVILDVYARTAHKRAPAATPG